jgi:preprotein translocase subunit YajC
MLDNLKKGDKVVTIGGIRGTVLSVKEQTVIVKVDETTKIEFSKSAVSSVIEVKDKEEKEEKEKKPSKKEALKLVEKEETSEESDKETT